MLAHVTHDCKAKQALVWKCSASAAITCQLMKGDGSVNKDKRLQQNHVVLVHYVAAEYRVDPLRSQAAPCCNFHSHLDSRDSL